MKSRDQLFCHTTAFLLAFGLVANQLLSGFASIAFAQDQGGSGAIAPKKPDRWESQPHLTDVPVRSEERIYKSTPQGDLKLHLWSPKADGKDRPCIVFFFGGGWHSGTYRQFARQSEYLASRGMVAASAEYRIRKLHNTTPDVCVEDAKSAIRWVRAHAEELGIDPAKVIAGGGSAGGHLAAASALVPGFDAEDDDLSISAIPNAMVLYNPGLNPSAKGREILDGQRKPIAKAISPNLFLHAKTPPAILFFGTADALAESGLEYLAKAKELGLDVEPWWAADQPHGFFNDSPWLEVTTLQLDRYLTRLGYLSGEPTITLPENAPSLKQEADEKHEGSAVSTEQ
ncbi:MAG: alpha/beta hydrolase [Planctomycetaceae bacterium]